MKNNNIPKTFLKNSNPWTPRQELSKAYQLSEWHMFLNPTELKENQIVFFEKQGGVIIDKRYSIDIDDNIDYELAKVLIQQN